MRNAKRAAKQFKRIYKIKGVPSVRELKEKIKQLGFEPCAYSESEHRLHETRTYRISQERPAFTYVKGHKRYVFYDDLLNEVDTKRVLAHEIGHLYCNHMNCVRTCLDTDVNKEWEANAFAAQLLKPLSAKMCIANALVVLALSAICFMSGAVIFQDGAKMSMGADAYVYVTPTGHSYHAENCAYGVEYANSIKIRRSDAQKYYLPCELCNPDKY